MSLFDPIPTSRLIAGGVVVGVVAVLAVMLRLVFNWGEGWKSKYETLAASEKSAAATHAGELHAAHNTTTVEAAAVARDVAAHPFVVHERVPACPASMPAGTKTTAGIGAPEGVAKDVPAGDRGLPSGPDPAAVTLLYDAYAQVFSNALIDLKEQQSVH